MRLDVNCIPLLNRLEKRVKHVRLKKKSVDIILLGGYFDVCQFTSP